MNTHRLTDATSPPSQPSSRGHEEAPLGPWEEGADAVRRVATAWLVVTVAFILTSLITWPINHQTLDWQPTLAFTQPWRAFSAAFVHYSPLHLAANLVGAVLVGLFGWAAQAPRHMTIAWLIAWPLTQFGLLVQPSLLHYGGLSGVLHAGVVIVCVHLMFKGTQTQRRVGVATLSVVIAKVLMEAPWKGPLSHPAEWDIAVAPMAHASGVVAGLLTGLLWSWLRRAEPKR
jgi:rhomboid family GlyGly-CTERM serine protease